MQLFHLFSHFAKNLSSCRLMHWQNTKNSVFKANEKRSIVTLHMIASVCTLIWHYWYIKYSLSINLIWSRCSRSEEKMKKEHLDRMIYSKHIGLKETILNNFFIFCCGCTFVSLADFIGYVNDFTRF